MPGCRQGKRHSAVPADGQTRAPGRSIEIRKGEYLNNVVEQEHRAAKRLVRPMLVFKFFWSAAVTLMGIELMHIIRNGQLLLTGELRPAKQFYSLVE
jgi:putative transposase